MIERPVRPSATFLAWGLVLLVVGGALAQAGQSARLEATLRAWSSGDEGIGQMLVGGVFALVGLVLLIVGVYRMAASVDMLASAARTREEGKR